MIFSWANVITTIIVGIVAVGKADECIPRIYGLGRTVCVCNSTYCDSTPRVVPEKGYYRIYESGKGGKRMASKLGSFEKSAILSNHKDEVKLTLNYDIKYQMIFGFGGAFTDSASELILRLDEETQQRLLESYFGQNGSRYNLGYVPIGSTDFSRRAYTYDDEEDDRLENFRLQNEDLMLKIPVIQKASHVNDQLEFVSAAESAPEWMKTEHDEYHGGFLKKKYYQTYADYLVKFLEAYEKHGIKIWAISPGQEPIDLGEMSPYKSTMSWSGKSVANWIAKHFGPSIAASEFNDTIILVGNDARMYIPHYVNEIFENDQAFSYVAGIAVHAAMDYIESPISLDKLQQRYPEKFLIVTSMAVGSLPWQQPKVYAGDWARGEKYIFNIIENLNHSITGYIDSSLVLDKMGGPNRVGSRTDAAIFVDLDRQEFYKQPIYYALAHFSKFISRGSIRIDTNTSDDFANVAFLTPDEETVIVVYNGESSDTTLVIQDPSAGYIKTNIPPQSIQTIIYKRE
ncbi:lysosomal acid glucosylceramidase-like [Venturia canescens]|uniref:lysosomal acid glucosylceramidase-like n=1 Tax=Venturia canescens TaxID=32260 RepID=UPI001C9BE340|nr:lysosomal acid glucosylceramidase-like [Venturia canescens]